jgi:hypothetical protein
MFKHGRVCIVGNSSSAGIIPKVQVDHVIAKGLGGGLLMKRHLRERCRRFVI